MGEAKLADLDRCVHGRHLQDRCFDCPDGRSTGNPYLFNGRRIGTLYSGEEIRCGRVRREDNVLALDRDVAIAAAVDDDGSVRLVLARDVPPEFVGRFDGRETGDARIYPGVLAVTRFPDGQSLMRWLKSIELWWAEERGKRPWL